MDGIKNEAAWGALKLTPPAVTTATGLTSEQAIAALTIAYLLILVAHQAYKFWRDIVIARREKVGP